MLNLGIGILIGIALGHYVPTAYSYLKTKLFSVATTVEQDVAQKAS